MSIYITIHFVCVLVVVGLIIGRLLSKEAQETIAGMRAYHVALSLIALAICVVIAGPLVLGLILSGGMAREKL